MSKITLAGCAIVENSCILLLHRSKRNWYELPGGKVDAGESPQEAAVRELKEELRCDVTILRQIGDKDFTEAGSTLNYVWFLAAIKEGQRPVVGEPDTFSHFKYVPLNKLSEYPLSPNMKNLAEEIKNRVILF